MMYLLLFILVSLLVAKVVVNSHYDSLESNESVSHSTEVEVRVGYVLPSRPITTSRSQEFRRKLASVPPPIVDFKQEFRVWKENIDEYQRVRTLLSS